MTMTHKQRIWDSMLDVEHLNRCYAAVAKEKQRWHFSLSVATILGSIGAATMLLVERTPATELGGAIFFFAVAAVSVVMVVYDFSRQAQVARTVSEQLRDVRVDLRRLWSQEDPELREIERLESRIDEITREDVIHITKALSARAYEEAFNVLKSYYDEPGKATATGKTSNPGESLSHVLRGPPLFAFLIVSRRSESLLRQTGRRSPSDNTLD